MSGVSSSGGVVPTFIVQLGSVADEVTGGNWKDREDALSDRIEDLIEGKQGFLADTSQGANNKEAFTVSVLKLVDALNDLDNKTEKVALTIQQLGSILQEEEPVVIDTTDLKHLPSDTAGEIQKSVDTFRALIKQEKPGAKESFAEWIEFTGMRVSQLKLSREELLEVAPHLTFLNFDADNFSEGDVHEIISKCKNLSTLVLQTNSIKTTPALPEGLKTFTLKFNANLEQVSSLNEGLREFRCSSNDSLEIFPKLPNSLVKFTCSDNPYVKSLPEFNPGLASVNCSNSRMDSLPPFPKSLEMLNMSQCYYIEKLEALPPGSKLQDLDVSKCEGLKSIPFPLPKNMKTLTISWCPELVLPDNFDTEKPSSLTVVK